MGEGVLPGFQCRGCSLGWDVEGGLYPGGCRVMWRARFSVSSFPRDLVSVCSVSSFEISFSRQYDFFCLR